MNDAQLEKILEAALMAAGRPLSLDELDRLFEASEAPSKVRLRECLSRLAGQYQGRGVELTEVASGFRFQVPAGFAVWVSRLWEEKPARYSRAVLETLSLVAYRQPITRAEIEDIRGVAVSTQIIRTLEEREWIRVVGHRDVPGKPAMFATTHHFLDDFGLRGLDGLPTLAEIRDLDTINAELELSFPVDPVGTAAQQEALGPEAEPRAVDSPDEARDNEEVTPS